MHPAFPLTFSVCEEDRNCGTVLVNIFMFDEDGQDLGLETRLQDVTFLSL
jgi:hypothetical protein